MSTSATLVKKTVTADRFQWQPPTSSIVRPPEGWPGRSRPDARDLVLPSAVAERVAVAEREGYARGLAEGQRAGYDAVRAQSDAALQRLAVTINDLAALRFDMIAKSERDLVRLAITIAERIVRQELSTDPGRIAALATDAVARLGESVVATIHLNPVDLDAVTERLGASVSGLSLLSDAQVPQGGCFVRSAFGAVDASIENQVIELSRQLLGDTDATTDTAAGEADSHGDA